MKKHGSSIIKSMITTFMHGFGQKPRLNCADQELDPRAPHNHVDQQAKTHFGSYPTQTHNAIHRLHYIINSIHPKIQKKKNTYMINQTLGPKPKKIKEKSARRALPPNTTLPKPSQRHSNHNSNKIIPTKINSAQQSRLINKFHNSNCFPIPSHRIPATGTLRHHSRDSCMLAYHTKDNIK
jgi:hypothetical protein